MDKTVSPPSLRDFASSPTPASSVGNFQPSGSGLSAEQLLNPPKMDFTRLAANSMELHSTSLEELEAHRKDLAYRVEWLQALLETTEQELGAVADAIAKGANNSIDSKHQAN